MRAVVEALRDLFGAARAVGSIGASSGEAVVDLGVGERALAEYEADVTGADGAGAVVTAHRTPYYVEEDFARDPLFLAHTASPAYNEWYRPHGLTRAVGMLALGDPDFVPDLYAAYDAPIVANVLLAGTSLSAGPDAGRARTMLALLQPALAASVQTWQRAGLVTAGLGAAVDGLGVAAWLFDADGRLVHESPAGGAAAGAADGVGAAAGALAEAMLRGRRERRPTPSAWAGTVGGAPVDLVGTHLRPEGRWAPAVLVTRGGLGRALPSAETVRERFGLTRQQTRVALLLAARRSTAEIAEALSISPHTVRRHTEQVLSRLGVARRTEVEGTLRQPTTR